MNHVQRTSPITLDEYRDYLQSWDGVRYKTFGCSRSGIDCLRFIIVVQDWLHGWDTDALPAIPQPSNQIALHDARATFRIIRWVSDRYPNDTIWNRKQSRETLVLSPGDILVARNQIYPGHALIGGPMRNTCWHALPDSSLPHQGCVHMTGIGSAFNAGLIKVSRMKESLLVTG